MKLKNLLSAVKYNLVAQKTLLRLKQLGIIVEPFYVIEEDVGQSVPREWGIAYDGFETSFLTEGDMPKVAECSGGPVARYLDRLERGHECFGIREGDRVVAFMWCDLKEFHLPYSFSLQPNEAYLYAAYTNRDYRGRGLARFLRDRAYGALRSRGIDTFYSASDFFNTPAIRFKKKLGARFLRLCLHLRLGNRRQRVWVLRNYQPDPAQQTSRLAHQDPTGTA